VRYLNVNAVYTGWRLFSACRGNVQFMDSLTQALLGAGVQGAVLGRFQGRRALVYGALLGTLPDLDVIIAQADPVSAMTNHRGFSHSLLVLTGLALLLSGLIHKCWPQARYGPWRLLLAVWLALITHPLLDAFTSYGTQLWWPWEPTPAVWSSIFIIDPVFTLPLLAAVWLGWRRAMDEHALRIVRRALGFCVLYLGFSLGSQHLAEQRVRAALARQGVYPQAVFLTPMPFNTLLWRVVARDGPDYIEAVSGVFDQREPEMVRLPLGDKLATALAASPEYRRLAWFTGNWLRYDIVGNNLVVTDLRMGMAGYYTFRFVMAQRDDAHGWVPIQPGRWPSPRGGWHEFKRMLKRIVMPAQPLPLQQWVSVLTPDHNGGQFPLSRSAPP